jgi:fibronectin type 3 domain-containing protein
VYNYDAAGLSNGTTYFFVVRASIGIYDSVNSNEVSSTPQVPAPGAPVLQTAVAGDGHVNLTWSAVEGSIGYKIYASTTSGSYTSPVDTVAGSVYSCDVTGLTNGTAYYFVVTASNPGGDSGYSNEISATPQVSAPSAPTVLRQQAKMEK